MMKITRRQLRRLIVESIELGQPDGKLDARELMKIASELEAVNPDDVFHIPGTNQISDTGSEVIATLTPMANRAEEDSFMAQELKDLIDLKGVRPEDAIAWYHSRTNS